MSLYDFTYKLIENKPKLLEEFYNLYDFSILVVHANSWASEFGQIYPCYGSMAEHYKYFNKGLIDCWHAMNFDEGKFTYLYDKMRKAYTDEGGKISHGFWAYEKGVGIMYELICRHKNLPEELLYLKHLPKKYEHLKGITEFLRDSLKK